MILLRIRLPAGKLADDRPKSQTGFAYSEWNISRRYSNHRWRSL